MLWNIQCMQYCYCWNLSSVQRSKKPTLLFCRYRCSVGSAVLLVALFCWYCCMRRCLLHLFVCLSLRVTSCIQLASHSSFTNHRNGGGGFIINIILIDNKRTQGRRVKGHPCLCSCGTMLAGGCLGISTVPHPTPEGTLPRMLLFKTNIEENQSGIRPRFF